MLQENLLTGVLMAGTDDSDGMVWLQHSVPRFVEDVTQGYAYTGSGRENGQLFLCLSMRLRSVEDIAEHLQVQAANVYQRHAPKWTQKYAKFWNILTKNYSRGSKSLKVDILKTTRGKPILAIAKPPNYSIGVVICKCASFGTDVCSFPSFSFGRNGGALLKTY
ncbi:hypothetical protein V5799_028009 [Amblyomma americanum]|uniref:Uncharacterized protein n=1 Tax=Amblyomma americanum TaxID=6943 RepID=A0AAQ4DE33_AMBAM